MSHLFPGQLVLCRYPLWDPWTHVMRPQYYPSNINHSRCCDQAICTECFVQIKRAEPTTTHLVSEPAACPYCVQENFGVVYTPPSWRAGLGSDGAVSIITVSTCVFPPDLVTNRVSTRSSRHRHRGWTHQPGDPQTPILLVYLP